MREHIVTLFKVFIKIIYIAPNNKGAINLI